MILHLSSFALPACPSGCGSSSLPALSALAPPPCWRREREGRPNLMLDTMLLKCAVGWLCASPVFVLSAASDSIAEKVVLYGGALTAAVYVWHKVVRPLVAGIASINDAYRAALIAEVQIAEIQRDINELKEVLNAKDS